MVDIIRIPKLGLSDYGELVSWEVDVGESVSSGQIVAVIESDKASAEIESPAAGQLLGTYVEEGEEIAIDVGKPLAVVGEAGAPVPALEEIDGEEAQSTGQTADTGTDQDHSTGDDPAGTPTDVTATPRARRRAEEADVELTDIEGTGPEGAVTVDDVERYLDVQGSAIAGARGDLTVTESRELGGTRKTIADRLTRSAREKPHVMGTREVRVEALERVRDRLDDRYEGSLSVNDCLLAIVGEVLQDYPAFNAHFEDGRHDLIEEVNVGYAVDGPRGLVVPVVSGVGERSVSDLAARRRTLVDRVQHDDHSAEDLQGGTFTVTNVGVFDMDVSYSIINPPEVAILAIGRRKYAPVERDGDVAFERVITFSLTIDHRVLDGADSGAFLAQLAEYVEHPELVFDDVEG